MADGMSHKDLRDLVHRFADIPVTYEHRGIQAFCKSTESVGILSRRVITDTFEKLKEQNPMYATFGSVKQAALTPDGAMFVLFETTSPLISKLVTMGALNNLSLTWTQTERNNHTLVDPIELTLCCSKPRLEHCHVIMGSPNMSALEPYMRTQCSIRSGVASRLKQTTSPIPTIMSAAEAEPAQAERQPEPTPQERAQEILDRIPNEGDRQLVQDTIARLYEGNSKAQSALAEENKALKTQLSSASDESAVIIDTLNTMIAQIGEQACKQNGITPERIEAVMRGKNMQQRDAAVHRVCAVHSAQMASILLSGQQAPLAHKRPRHAASRVGAAAEAEPESTVYSKEQFDKAFAAAWGA